MMVNNQKKRTLYDLETIKRLVQAGKFELVNRRARTRYKELAWSSSELKALIQSLDVSRHYRGPAVSMESDIGKLDVDKYAIKFDEDALCEDPREGLEFFLKLALVDDDTSTAVVSFHLSGSP